MAHARGTRARHTRTAAGARGSGVRVAVTVTVTVPDLVTVSDFVTVTDFVTVSEFVATEPARLPGTSGSPTVPASADCARHPSQPLDGCARPTPSPS